MRKARKEAYTTHGMTGTPEYDIWLDMRRRCYNPKRADYPRYGGRGITVCAEWREDFAVFYSDMGSRPLHHTLERRDNDGPYNKSNCIWATRSAQNRNTRANHFVDIDNQVMTLAEAAEKFGIKYYTLCSRLNLYGWSLEKALHTPVKKDWRRPKGA